MCLTEPHAGSDVGILSTTASPNDDGSYRLNGTKIFITYGDHDMADNIVHLVLARLPDAATGRQGHQPVPGAQVRLPDADGNPGKDNGVQCASIEEKLGIHGSPTCVMNFEDATGWLIGPPHGGLRCMFTMMNFARIDVGMHALGQAERSFQGAVAQYARERLQFRAPDGPVMPDKKADPDHRASGRPPYAADPEVDQPRVAARSRTVASHAAGHRASPSGQGGTPGGRRAAGVSHPDHQGHPDRDSASRQPTTGFRCSAGHGYISETGMDQYMRDARITSIYEGTNAIQANDLLHRKVLGSDGALLRRFLGPADELIAETKDDAELGPLAQQLDAANREWVALTERIEERVSKSRAEMGAAAFDFLMYSGYCALGYYWLRMAKVASAALAAGTGEEDFYRAKVLTAKFYFARLLPRTQAHAAAIDSGAANLMTLSDDAFVL